MGWVDPWVGLGRDFFSFWWAGLGPLQQMYKKFERIHFNAFKVRLDKIWLHQAVKFDFVADLAGTGNRSEGVIK